jgi:hypothetical protein
MLVHIQAFRGAMNYVQCVKEDFTPVYLDLQNVCLALPAHCQQVLGLQVPLTAITAKMVPTAVRWASQYVFCVPQERTQPTMPLHHLMNVCSVQQERPQQAAGHRRRPFA